MLKTSVITETILEEAYDSGTHASALNAAFINFVQEKRKTRVLKIWFQSEIDAEEAMVDLTTTRDMRCPKAKLVQKANFVVISLNGEDYIIPPTIEKTISKASEIDEFKQSIKDFITDDSKEILKIKCTKKDKRKNTLPLLNLKKQCRQHEKKHANKQRKLV